MARPLPNFESDRILIIRYNVGAGGKFLSACLSMSHGVVVPNTDLAQQEMQGKLTKQQLQEILLSRAINSDGQWDDFGLYDYTFWGFEKFRLFSFDVSTVGLLEWGPLIPDLTRRNDRWLCTNLHPYFTTMRLGEVWPNATILFIENPDRFKDKFRPHRLYGTREAGLADLRINLFWKNCRGSDWPLWAPKSKEEYDNLPSWIKDEIKDLYNDEILDYFRDIELEKKQTEIEKQMQADLMKKHPSILWDADWYLDPEVFNDKCRWLYQQLGLTDYNESLVMGFYHGWILALQQDLETAIERQKVPGKPYVWYDGNKNA